MLCSLVGSSEVGSPQLTLEDSLQRGQATRTALTLGTKNSALHKGPNDPCAL